MPTTGASSTPQTFRYQALRDQQQAHSLTQQLRNSFDSEAWDDNANVIFSTMFPDQMGVVAGAGPLTVGTLTIPCLIPVRVHIVFRSTEAVLANGQAIQRCLVDGIQIPTSATQFQSAAATTITMTYNATADLTPGSHVLTFQVEALTSNADFLVNSVIVRRGRVPSP